MTNNNLLILLFSSFFLLSCSITKNDNNTNSDWVNLLEGDLSQHWKMYSDEDLKGWKMMNGELQASGAGWDKNEDLITKEEYDNFELQLEWKIESQNSSGIFYYVQQKDDQPIYESAPEYQLIDDEGWTSELKPNQNTAGNYAMHAPEGAKTKPIGAWNTTKIIVNYPKVEHWLNGKKVVDYEFSNADWRARKAADKWADVADYGTATSGHIGLQNAGKVTFREIRVREL